MRARDRNWKWSMRGRRQIASNDAEDQQTRTSRLSVCLIDLLSYRTTIAVHTHTILHCRMPRFNTSHYIVALTVAAQSCMFIGAAPRFEKASHCLHFLSSTCTDVSGVENIGQCGRLSQLSWLLGAL